MDTPRYADLAWSDGKRVALPPTWADGREASVTVTDWGLADDRWKLIADASFALHVSFEKDDGSEGRFAPRIPLDYAKVKFAACGPHLAKFCLLLDAREIEC